MTSLASWGPSADSSRLEVKLHWRLCHWSWSASDWRDAFESQTNAVFLGERRWRDSSRQPGSWERAHRPMDKGGDLEVEPLPHWIIAVCGGSTEKAAETVVVWRCHTCVDESSKSNTLRQLASSSNFAHRPRDIGVKPYIINPFIRVRRISYWQIFWYFMGPYTLYEAAQVLTSYN